MSKITKEEITQIEEMAKAMYKEEIEEQISMLKEEVENRKEIIKIMEKAKERK